jgi:phage terminase Nu1 subunit (DNA packaging protein)
MTKGTKPAAAGVSGARLAELLGLNERTVRKLADDGILVRVGRGLYDQDASILRYVTHLRDVSARRANSSEAASSHARYKLAQAELAELDLAQTRGEVLDRDEVQDTWHALLLAVRQTLLRLPNQLAFEVPSLSAHDRSRFAETCRNALWDLVLGRGFAVLGDSGERCDGCGGVIPALGDDDDVRRANEHAVYPDEREKVLGTRSGEKE